MSPIIQEGKGLEIEALPDKAELLRAKSKKRLGLCMKCGISRRIHYFKCYLSGRHSCFICDPCYSLLLLADSEQTQCPKCPLAFTDRKKQAAKAAISAAKILEIYCAV